MIELKPYLVTVVILVEDYSAKRAAERIRKAIAPVLTEANSSGWSTNVQAIKSGGK